MGVERVFIVGAGLMGSGIAQICAQAGMSVGLCDTSPAALDRARQSIGWSLAKLVEKGAVPEPVDATLGRIAFTTRPEDGSAADLVIEAVFERLDAKREVLAAMDRIAPAHAPIATNTSALSITTLAACTARPDRVLGLHFFSPVPMMKAVEVVRGMATSDETFAAGRAFVVAVGKEPVLVLRDEPGFIVNRINLPSTIEAIKLVEQGVASVEDIDRGMRLATGRRMGPFETGDLVGLDVTYGALMALYEETGDPRWFPPQLLRRKVRAGQLGRKAGRGWYEYGPNGAKKE
jgi:3-hydroxybutyryl-CoA dehydrogenase